MITIDSFKRLKGEEIGMSSHTGITFKETVDPQGANAGKSGPCKKLSRDPSRKFIFELTSQIALNISFLHQVHHSNGTVINLPNLCAQTPPQSHGYQLIQIILM